MKDNIQKAVDVLGVSVTQPKRQRLENTISQMSRKHSRPQMQQIGGTSNQSPDISVSYFVCFRV